MSTDIDFRNPFHLVQHQAYSFIQIHHHHHIQIPTTITLLNFSTLLSPHNRGPNHLSVLLIFHTHLTFPHLHLHRTTILLLSAILITSYLQGSSTHEYFPSMGEALWVTMCWCAVFGTPGIERAFACLSGDLFMLSILPLRRHLNLTLFSLFFFPPFFRESPFSVPVLHWS